MKSPTPMRQPEEPPKARARRLVRHARMALYARPGGEDVRTKVDRHEHIGAGTLGLLPFRLLVNDPRFAEIPGFVETDSRWKENIEVLRGLVRR